MPTNHVDEQLNLHRNLGVTRPPEKVTQEAFEGDDRHLRRLAQLRPGEVADGDDLWEYVHELALHRYSNSTICLPAAVLFEGVA